MKICWYQSSSLKIIAACVALAGSACASSPNPSVRAATPEWPDLSVPPLTDVEILKKLYGKNASVVKSNDTSQILWNPAPHEKKTYKGLCAKSPCASFVAHIAKRLTYEQYNKPDKDVTLSDIRDRSSNYLALLIEVRSAKMNESHASAPAIDVAILRFNGDKWMVNAFRRAAIYAGSWGRFSGDAEIISLGKNHKGIKFSSGFSNMGIVEEISLLIWAEEGVIKTFDLGQTLHAHSVIIDGFDAYTRWDTMIYTIPSKDKLHFDLNVFRSGTKPVMCVDTVEDSSRCETSQDAVDIEVFAEQTCFEFDGSTYKKKPCR